MAAPKRLFKPMPLRGRRSSWPADSIGAEYSPNALNIRFRFGEARSGPGRALFSGAPTSQESLLITNFSKANNTIWPLMMTDNKLFRRGIGAPGDVNAWINTPGTFTPSGGRRWGNCVGEDKFFFSNGRDQIAYWDGDGSHSFDLISSVAGFEGYSAGTLAPTARYLEYFNDRIIAGYVEEGGTILANRIRWSQSADFRKWDETKQLGAGFLDLNEEGAEVVRGIRALGERCVIYKAHSIGDLTPTGTLSPTHIHNVRVRNIGLGGPYTVGNSGQAHFFLGNDQNVWMWDGSTPTPVGDPIHEEIKALTYRDTFDRYFGTCIPSRYEYWLLLADSQRGMFDAFIYDYLRGFWTRDTFPNLTAIGEIEVPLIQYIWLTIPGIWTDWPIAWADLSATRVTKVIGGRTDSATMDIDEQFASDYFTIGSITDRVLETEDMYIETPWDNNQAVRLLLTYEFVNNQPFEIGMSGDRGRTWFTKEIVPTDLGYSFVEFTRSSNVIRFRFRENNALGQFRWRSYVAEFLPIGDFIQTRTS